MYQISLQYPPDKHFDPCDVEHLLSMLEMDTGFFSTNFKLAMRTATLLALLLQSIVLI